MRISDWSSDVCSSDLPRTYPSRPGLSVFVARLGIQLEEVEAVLNHLSGSKAGIVGALDYKDEKRSALEHGHCSECSSPSAQPSSSRVGRERIAGLPPYAARLRAARGRRIGIASCRDRLCQYVWNQGVAGIFKK